MSKAEERRQLAIAAAQQALGALHHVSPAQMVAEVGGRRAEIVLHSVQVHTRSGGRSVPNRALELRFPLAVPSNLGIELRSNYVHVGPVSIVATGEPGFDATYVVPGVPSEVVQRALDGPTRAWIQQYGQPHLALGADAGALTFHHSVALPHENPRQPLTPQFLFDAANALCHFANTLEATYRTRRAEIVAQQGEASALAWEEHNNKLIAAQPLRWVRWALAGVSTPDDLLDEPGASGASKSVGRVGLPHHVAHHLGGAPYRRCN